VIHWRDFRLLRKWAHSSHFNWGNRLVTRVMSRGRLASRPYECFVRAACGPPAVPIGIGIDIAVAVETVLSACNKFDSDPDPDARFFRASWVRRPAAW